MNNYELYRYKYLNAQTLDLKVPVDISLELSSACSLQCSYCYHSDQSTLPFKKGFMSLDLAKSIIDQAAILNVHSIKFNYRGESTLNPNYSLITKHCKNLSYNSTFIDRLANSNFFFHPSRRESIFEGLSNLTKVKVSFDSFIPEVFNKQRTGANFDLVSENIDLFYNHKSRIRSETKIVIQAVRTLLNKDEDLESEIKRRWPTALISIRDMVIGRVDKDLSELEHRNRSEERQSCIQAHARLIIHHDGKVGACCPDIKGQHYLGNTNTESIYDIFNSDKAKKLRSDLLSKKAFDKDPCKSCSSYESYSGFKPSIDS